MKTFIIEGKTRVGKSALIKGISMNERAVVFMNRCDQGHALEKKIVNKITKNDYDYIIFEEASFFRPDFLKSIIDRSKDIVKNKFAIIIMVFVDIPEALQCLEGVTYVSMQCSDCVELDC